MDLGVRIDAVDEICGMILTWELESGGLVGLEVIADCPAAIEQEWAKFPTCVPCSWARARCLPHWTCAVVTFIATETNAVSFSRSRRNLAGSTRTSQRS